MTDLLKNAFVHRSYLNESSEFGESNERLEYLGDAVLELATSDFLYRTYPDYQEGMLTNIRAALVRTESLAEVALNLGFDKKLLMSKGEEATGGRQNRSILADALEALFGAVFLDGGFGAAQGTILRLYGNALSEVDPRATGKDPKTMLQEFLQGRHIALPKYVVVSASGAAHSRQFEVECVIPELSVCTTGSGNSRRVAEQEAAQRAYERLRK